MTIAFSLEMNDYIIILVCLLIILLWWPISSYRAVMQSPNWRWLKTILDSLKNKGARSAQVQNCLWSAGVVQWNSVMSWVIVEATSAWQSSTAPCHNFRKWAKQWQIQMLPFQGGLVPLKCVKLLCFYFEKHCLRRHHISMNTSTPTRKSVTGNQITVTYTSRLYFVAVCFFLIHRNKATNPLSCHHVKW